MRTAPEGRWFIVGAWAIALVLIVLAARSGSAGWWIGRRRCGPLLAIWVVAFFRDPERVLGPRAIGTDRRPGGRQGGERDRDRRAGVPRGPRAPDLDLHERVRLST